jgi:hypothetical protein
MLDVPKKVESLFDELIVRGEELKNACKKLSFSGNKKTIDPQTYEAWKTSCLTLIRSTFGTSSPHYDSFANLKFFDYYNSTLIYLGILQSAREDVRKGYFFHKDLMLSVNIFTAFLSRVKAYAEEGSGEKAVAILDAVATECLKKLAESRRLSGPLPAGIGKRADELLTAGALSRDLCDKLNALDRFLKEGPREEGENFASWNSWLQKFLYENLGSQILILN